MFTGIITETGIVEDVQTSDGGKIIKISASENFFPLDIGSSVMCNGACMTVTGINDSFFTIFVSVESLQCTTIDEWHNGTVVNLEKSLKIGDTFDGHIVCGHVDSITVIDSIEKDGENRKITFSLPDEFMRYIAIKGSVTLDGISLTVNGFNDNHFWVNVIPHTLQNTTLGNAKPGDKINFEADMLARYTERLLQTMNDQ